MALTVVGRFSTLPEAQVAASALRSAGLFAVVMNETFGATWPQMWTAMQGIEVAVDHREALTARSILDGADAAPRDQDDVAEAWRGRPHLADYLVATFSAVAGLLAGVPFVRKRWRRR